jgi:peptidyl-prolyl cis-trans isomerase D
MAVMSSLRDKTHIILYTLMAAFLALIVFEWGMNFTGYSGKKSNQAGTVNGKVISASQYDEAYKAITENFQRSNPGVEVTPEIEFKLQEQAWETLKNQTLLDQQFEKFGITIQDQEVIDALNSPTPPMVIRQFFTNPATGVIDRNKLESVRRDPREKEVWKQLQKYVSLELKQNKLLRALLTLNHVTERELGDLVTRVYTRFSASFIPVPLSFAGAESNFKVSDEEIKKYYEEHKELLKESDKTRKADFVFFPLIPSAKDSLAARTELEAIRAEFSRTVNDSDYVKVQSDSPTGYNKVYTHADFSPAAGDSFFTASNLVPGKIVGPIADQGAYRLIKIKQVTSAQPVARASHILLSFNSASTDDVKRVRELSMFIFKQLQAGVSFDALARKYSADTGSAVNGGDIGWFSKERVVPQFAAAVFNSRPGSIVGPVQTQYGLHIIKVTGLDTRAVVCSEIVRNIRPSTETTDSQRRLATAFQIKAKENGFDKSVAASKLQINRTGEFIKHMLIPQIGYNDKVNAFAFKAGEGDLSDVIETEKGFYVMRLTGKNDTGYRLLDQSLKARITSQLVREKKSALLEKKLATMVKVPGVTLEKIAASHPGLRVVAADSIRWIDGFIPGYGVDQPLVEAMSGLAPGHLSSPVKTNDGYALVRVNRKTVPAGFDLQAEKAKAAPQLMQAAQQQQQRFIDEYLEAVRKTATIIREDRS